MKITPKIIVGGVLIVVGLLIIYIYQFMGLRYKLDAYSYIESLPEAQKEEAMKMLTIQNSNPYFYSGILASTETRGDTVTGLWVWANKDIKHFTTVGGTTFSTFSICEGEKWKQEEFNISKNENVPQKEWISKAKKGDYISLALVQGEKGSTNVVGEASVYDWWVFAPVSNDHLEKTCANR